MTLSVRNNCFKGGIFIAFLALGLVAAGAYFAFPAFLEAAAQARLRPGGIIQSLIANFFEPSLRVPFYAILGAVVYSLTSIILILYFFEKTQSPEILFFGFFVISFSFEFLRMIIPLRGLFSFSAMYMISASRVLLFGRYFGLFSLFAAGVYAAGLDVQKQQNVFIMLIMSALIIALNVPVDSLSWDSTLKMITGYGPMLNMVEAGIMIITVLTFFISAYTRGSNTYVFIGIGIFLVFLGRNILLASDIWLSFIAGFLALAAGTWFTCTRLHREYLWL